MIEIDYKLHNLIAGRKRAVIQSIQEETATNIYFPTSFSTLFGSNQSLSAKQNLIFITGDFFGVQRAREMIYRAANQTVSLPLCSLSPREYDANT